MKHAALGLPALGCLILRRTRCLVTPILPGRGCGAATFFLALALAPAMPARAAYVFVNIADTTGPIAGGILSPQVNNAGTVVFRALRDAGAGGGQAVFTGNGGPLTTVADTAGPISGFFNPAINDAGQVAYRAD